MFIVLLWIFFLLRLRFIVQRRIFKKTKFLQRKEGKWRSFIKWTVHYCASCFSLIPTFLYIFYFIFTSVGIALSRISSLTCYTPHAENNIKTFDVSILFATAHALLHSTYTHYALLFIYIG